MGKVSSGVILSLGVSAISLAVDQFARGNVLDGILAGVFGIIAIVVAEELRERGILEMIRKCK